MNNPLENSTPSTDNRLSSDERKQSPPAFLDLADSVRSNSSLFPFLLHADLFSFFKAARLGTNMPDMPAVRPFLLPPVFVFTLYF
jgi:hypothetical protein